MATVKQKKAINKLVETGGNVSRAMVLGGYSEATAHTPSKLTDSRAFKEWLEEAEVSDKILADKIREGLDATRAIVMGKDSKESFVDIQPDYAIRHKYIETALKIKGHMESSSGNKYFVFPIYGGRSVERKKV